ncbi:hypothetical protein [Endothiovibrio diazotrophicus]
MVQSRSFFARSRKADIALGLLLGGVLAVAASVVHARWAQSQAAPALAEKRALVRDLGLTDLCLFTEARYTRHPSQADLASAFQDHPLALDHFPSGSLIGPPSTLTVSH